MQASWPPQPIQFPFHIYVDDDHEQGDSQPTGVLQSATEYQATHSTDGSGLWCPILDNLGVISCGGDSSYMCSVPTKIWTQVSNVTLIHAKSLTQTFQLILDHVCSMVVWTNFYGSTVRSC